MNLAEIVEIIEALAEGVNPVNGEPLPDESPYHDSRVIRALYAAARMLRQQPSHSKLPKSQPANAGVGWDDREDELLIRAFEANVPIRAIATKHERTRGAIVARLMRLGILVPRHSTKSINENVPKQETAEKWWKLEGRTQAGKAWTTEEDKALLVDFKAGMTVEQLAQRRRRGVRAVEVRLIKVGKLNPSIDAHNVPEPP
jgi:hypothetical protein